MEYQSQTKNCQNCKKDFIIESDDFSFYEKMKVSVPTFCQDCKKTQVMSFINMRSFYKRNCNLCNKSIVTLYHTNDTFPVYCTECWQSDNWDASIYAQEIDFNKPFFIQWNELSKEVPKLSLRRVQMIDSEYTNLSVQCNHCYFGYSLLRSEYVNYSENVDDSKNCTDCLCIKENEWCYENIDCAKNYNCCYMSESRSCINSQFLFDCANCQDCFMSSNLRNKSYIYRNVQITKEEYLIKIKQENLGSYISVQSLLKEFQILKMNSFHKYADIINSINVSGNHILNSRNVKNSYFITDGENIVESMRTPGAKDLYNCFYIANSESMYACVACSLGSYKIRNCMYSNGSKDSDYSFFCINCENIFGCFGLKNKKYFIFNKQYTKEEYFELREKIIQHMNNMPYIDKIGRIYKYGEFYPIEMSPFSYNETIARDYYPLSEEQVKEQGFKLLENNNRSYTTNYTKDTLPDLIEDIPDDIVSGIIECAHKGECYNQCTTAFRILPEDLQFYRKMNIPIPRLCSNCRYYERLYSRPPAKLWHRSCMKEGCKNEFETSYTKESPEIVYCEKCYKQEIY